MNSTPIPTTTALSPSAGGVFGLRQRLLLSRQEMRKLKARRNHGLSEDLEYLRRRTTETETLDAHALIQLDVGTKVRPQPFVFTAGL